MARAESSILLGGGLVAATLVVALRLDGPRGGPLAAEPAVQTAVAEPVRSAPAPAPGDAAGYDEAYKRYLAVLDRLRRGDESAREELRASGEELCARHRRCDAADVAGYYAGLTAEELARGLEAEAQYRGIWNELRDANAAEGMSAAEWDELRDDIAEEIGQFVTEVLAQADFIPAGRALSLLARLEVEQIERDRRLSPAELEDLVHRAEGDAERALALFERAGMVTPTLEPQWLLGRLDFARKRMAIARETFDSLLELAEQVRNDDYREHALEWLLWIARDAGDVAEADRLLQALARLRSPKRYWVTAREHAESLLHEDQPEEALEFLLANTPSSDADRDQWNLLMGGAKLRLANVAGARAHFETLDAAQPERRLALAQLDLREGRPQEVVRGIGDPASLADLRADLRAEARWTLGEAQLALNDPAAAVRSLTEAFAEADRWRVQFDSGRKGQDPVVSIVGEVIGVQAVVLLARAHAELGDALEAARVIEDFQARSMAASRSTGAASRSSGVRRGSDRAEPAPPSVPEELSIESQDLEAWAATFEAGLVTWAVGADSTVVAHVGPAGDADAWLLPHGRLAVREAARRLREAAIQGDEAKLGRLAREVRDGLFPPELLQRIAAAPRGARLLCLLHGPLEELPIEVLTGGGALDESLVLLALPGLPAREPGEPARPSELASWSLLGDPLVPAGAATASLPGTRDEIADLARLHPGSVVHTAAAFDRAALERELAGSRPLHVATHLVDGCESRTSRLSGVGLYLSEGDVFCPSDIQAASPALPLVALSACESQAGRFIDAEGLHGIARAFLEAGTRNLLVTSWPIEDRAAQAFALAFHEALGRPLPPSRAAADARAELRRRGFGPADWAGFRLLGRD